MLLITFIAIKQPYQVCRVEEGHCSFGGLQTPVIRDGGKKGDAQYELDRALLLYKCKASTRMTSSYDDTLKMMARPKGSRKHTR